MSPRSSSSPFCLGVFAGVTYTKGKSSLLKSLFLLPRPQGPCCLWLAAAGRGWEWGRGRGRRGGPSRSGISSLPPPPRLLLRVVRPGPRPSPRGGGHADFRFRLLPRPRAGGWRCARRLASPPGLAAPCGRPEPPPGDGAARGRVRPPPPLTPAPPPHGRLGAAPTGQAGGRWRPRTAPCAARHREEAGQGR